MSEFLSDLALDEWRAALRNGHSDRDSFTRAALDAIDANRALNAIVAKRLGGAPEPSAADGPLAGVPVAIKDCFVDRDRAPSVGSKVDANWMTGTAAVIDRLLVAGAAVVAYTNLDEWMLATTGRESAFGAVVNPRDPGWIAGGSSGGSAAAIAGGLVPLAVGSDAGGSLRVPAACCGVVGFKPTWGLVPTRGFVDDRSPIDHVGPLARNVADAHLLLEALAQRRIPLPDVRSLRVGIAREFFFGDADPEVADAVMQAIARLAGAVAGVVEVRVKDARVARRSIGAFILRDVASMLARERPHRHDHLLPGARAAVEVGARMTRSDRETADRARMQMRQSWEEVFDRVDVVVTPTLPAPIPAVGDRTVRLPEGVVDVDRAQVAWNAPMNLGGVPCLSLPCGALSDGRPVGLSVTAKAYEDGAALALGALIETA